MRGSRRRLRPRAGGYNTSLAVRGKSRRAPASNRRRRGGIKNPSALAIDAARGGDRYTGGGDDVKNTVADRGSPPSNSTLSLHPLTLSLLLLRRFARCVFFSFVNPLDCFSFVIRPARKRPVVRFDGTARGQSRGPQCSTSGSKPSRYESRSVSYSLRNRFSARSSPLSSAHAFPASLAAAAAGAGEPRPSSAASPRGRRRRLGS